jgi:hypothetical protein
MASQISDQIARLRTLPRSGLLALWQELHKKAPPCGIRREILVPFLAYKIQENRFGGLKPATRAELRRIARELPGNSGCGKRLVRPKAKSGTRLLRPWRGAMHEVVVTNSGYEYRGTGYRTLSEIARKITGTRWSGPAFFGLNKVPVAPGRSDA